MEQPIPSRAEDEIRQRKADRAKLDKILKETNSVFDPDYCFDCKAAFVKVGMDLPFYTVVVHSHIKRCCPKCFPQALRPLARLDIYVYLASKIFGVPEENITSAMRQAAKNKIYWMIYR